MQKIFLILIFLGLTKPIFAQFSQDIFFNSEAGYFNVDTDGVLLKGYDVVGYFSKKKALKGNPQFQANYKGATFFFENAQNLETFKQNPENYLPQYGGWCAMGLLYGGQNWGFPNGKYPANPSEFLIENGKLYLFFEIPKQNTKKTFSKNFEKYVLQADQQWQKIHDLTMPNTYNFAQKNKAVWQRSTDYLLAVAAAMPEENFDFKPTDSVFSFREQLQHLCQNMYRLQKYITQKESPFREISFADKNKSQILEEIQKANQNIAQILETTPDQEWGQEVDFFVKNIHQTKQGIFYLIQNHLAHHRGECIVYLRLKGIKAPVYVGW